MFLVVETFLPDFTINWYKTSLLTLDKLLSGQGGRVTLGPFKYPYNRTMVQKFDRNLLCLMVCF